jgi:TRAP-type C4-dicarboxylate transport system substrate-binding protein
MESSRSKRALLGAGLVTAAAFALGGTPTAQAQQAIKWNMPTPYAEASFHTKNTKQFADEVRQATGGRLEISVHPNGSLFKLPEMKRAVQSGQAQIAEVNLPAFGNENPFYELDVVLFLAQGYEDAERLWKLSRPIIENTLQAQGIQVLYVVPFPGMGMVSKKPINRLADLKGMRFRSFGPAASRFGELVGATPTVIQASELSQAFTVGAIDSTLTSASTAVSTKSWEYAKYFIDLQAAHTKQTIIVNTAAFKALPADIQAAVLKASAAAEQRGWAASRREADETRERLVKEGVIIVKPDEAFRGELGKLGVTLASDWEKRAGAEGTGVLKAYRQ